MRSNPTPTSTAPRLGDLNKTIDELRKLENEMQQTLVILERHTLYAQIMLGRVIQMRQQVDALHKQALASA